MKIPEQILNRKGARKVKDVPSEVLDLLNSGHIESKNLSEWLAIDHEILVESMLSKLGKIEWLTSIKEALSDQKKPSANNSIRIIGQTLGTLTEDSTIFKSLRESPSDSIKSYCCWAESIQFDSTEDLLRAMRPYAADKNAGMREVVIFASKERLAADLSAAILHLTDWAREEDENIRRYAVECMRPIGVWTKKIQDLKDDPQLALPILECVKNDPSKYVQNAVGNWLNDASKSRPDWVKEVCAKWESESDSKSTAYIVKRGMRTINKANA